MKLKDVTNVEKFFETINECVDDVDLVGPGVNIHLKSPIAQMVCASIFTNNDINNEIKIVTYNSDDYNMILKLTNEED